MTACPGDEQLRQLLADAVAEAEREAIVTHVEACPACQQLLARLSNDPGGLDWDLLHGAPAAGLPEVDAAAMRRR